jgi:hypothetical protein
LSASNPLILYFSYKDIVEDKSTKAFMVDRKKKAWELIENHYNCSAETGSRNSKQLKVLYENLKRATCKPRIIAGVRSERI